MTDPKDGQPKPGTNDEIRDASRKARLHKETFATPGIGARVLQRRHVPQTGNDKGDDTTPPEGKGR